MPERRVVCEYPAATSIVEIMSELREWLDSHRIVSTEFTHRTKPTGAIEVRLAFETPDQAMLFKREHRQRAGGAARSS